MGISYVHDKPVPASVSIEQGQDAAALIINHIKAEQGFEITNDLDIKLRQKPGSELSWVTITNGATAATSAFDLCPPLGDHELILESIDNNSPLSSPSVLKTDVIILSITASTDNRKIFLCNPYTLRFEHELEMVVLTVGQTSEWTLPKVLNAYMDSYEITAEPDLQL